MFAAGNGSLYMPAVERTLKRQSLRMPIRSPASFLFPTRRHSVMLSTDSAPKIIVSTQFYWQGVGGSSHYEGNRMCGSEMDKGRLFQLCNNECWQGKDGQRCQHLNIELSRSHAEGEGGGSRGSPVWSVGPWTQVFRRVCCLHPEGLAKKCLHFDIISSEGPTDCHL